MDVYVRKLHLSPAVRMCHVKSFEKTRCKYPVRRVEVKMDTVPTGNMNYVQDNIFIGDSCQRDSIWSVSAHKTMQLESGD